LVAIATVIGGRGGRAARKGSACYVTGVPTVLVVEGLPVLLLQQRGPASHRTSTSSAATGQVERGRGSEGVEFQMSLPG
jgi:hypothetical protein